MRLRKAYDISLAIHFNHREGGCHERTCSAPTIMMIAPVNMTTQKNKLVGNDPVLYVEMNTWLKSRVREKSRICVGLRMR